MPKTMIDNPTTRQLSKRRSYTKFRIKKALADGAPAATIARLKALYDRQSEDYLEAKRAQGAFFVE